MVKGWRENKCFRKFDFSGQGIDLHSPRDIILGKYDYKFLCTVCPLPAACQLHPLRPRRLSRLGSGVLDCLFANELPASSSTQQRSMLRNFIKLARGATLVAS